MNVPDPTATDAGRPARPVTVRHHIGGEWTEPLGGGTYPDHDPWTGSVMATVAAGDAEDARRAV
ncbi:5-carboxymethyl-2-hydroxymuconate semialdehyde dehydrogenase, partial [Streptomyces sp. T21Q-yed]|nr:5-carboxymethyl-2-hydroxymuconate semialdehyde dehydrogenase [Streptomyces sp. T21Q-yed]